VLGDKTASWDENTQRGQKNVRPKRETRVYRKWNQLSQQQTLSTLPPPPVESTTARHRYLVTYFFSFSLYWCEREDPHSLRNRAKKVLCGHNLVRLRLHHDATGVGPEYPQLGVVVDHKRRPLPLRKIKDVNNDLRG